MTLDDSRHRPPHRSPDSAPSDDGSASPDIEPLENVETGVPGFDEILGGGFVRGGLYLIEGMASAGKTILSSQIGFHRVRQGDRVLYMTLIAESHDKLLGHLRALDFFDPAAVAQKMMFVSGYHELMQDGLDGFLRLIAASLANYRPGLLIVDGFRSAREFSETELSLSKFIHELNALVAAMGCTTLLLAPLSGNEPHPEHTLVDGLIELNRYTDGGMRRAREIEVHKMRARNHLLGRHFFRITSGGHAMYPRLEARFANLEDERDLHQRLDTGLPHLDHLLGGGFVRGSVTTVMGPSGVGKTLLALQFLKAGVARDEKVVYLGFYESPQRLIGKAETVGIRLREAFADGRLSMQWQPAVELEVDELAANTLALIQRLGASRLVIDGMEGFRDSALRPARFGLFLNAFTHALRDAGVTMLVIEELPLYPEPSNGRSDRLCALAENLIVLHYADSDGQLRRTLSVVKQRESAHDTSVRELAITPEGLGIADGPTLFPTPGVFPAKGR
ncbi:ATPase domain-containing protein [Burkholderia plantarii]|uniref:ATPase domain-containing protein n=3 Tax=Burkholderia plantarii TaxID=41899 RepID=UPI0006D89EB1|nr:ATPase domain-containing protein [Burkholderia plantarii]ALK32722.1 Non-specific serine/threonine protein kinase [Burkholderia plantarii]